MFALNEPLLLSEPQLSLHPVFSLSSLECADYLIALVSKLRKQEERVQGCSVKSTKVRRGQPWVLGSVWDVGLSPSLRWPSGVRQSWSLTFTEHLGMFPWTPPFADGEKEARWLPSRGLAVELEFRSGLPARLPS